jgi:AcrR family transcriptional regulator
MKATTSPRKKPRQDRSQATVDVIFEAAARVFEEVGFEGATTNAFAERAGVSVGSLYQYFPNKLAVLRGLQERHLEANMRKLADACDRGHEGALSEAVRHISEISAGNHVKGQALSRVFHAELPPIWPDRQGRACVIHFRERLRAFLEAHRSSISVEIDQAVFFTMALGGSLVKAGLADRPQDFGNGVIAREMAEAILLFLTGTRESMPASARGVA